MPTAKIVPNSREKAFLCKFPRVILGITGPEKRMQANAFFLGIALLLAVAPRHNGRNVFFQQRKACYFFRAAKICRNNPRPEIVHKQPCQILPRHFQNRISAAKKPRIYAAE